MPSEEKIAVISDIHANLPALEAVLRDIEGQPGIKRIFNLGDNVGYGPYPNEVIKEISKSRYLNITGNYDLKVLKVPVKGDKWSLSKRPLKYFAFKWTFDKLSDKSKKFMKSLDKKRTFETAGKKILLCHGSPESIDEHLTPGLDEQRYIELAENLNADVILFGHSHLQFFKELKDTLFLNPGSVGRPEGTNGKACYAILKISDSGIGFEHKQIEYDMDKLVNRLRTENIPREFEQVFILGKNLEDVMQIIDEVE